MDEGIDDLLLLWRQAQRICWVYRWETFVEKFVFLPVEGDGALLVVNSLQQNAVHHAPFGVGFVELPFELELHDGDGFVHLRNQACVLLCRYRSAINQTRHKQLAGIVGIMLNGEGCEGNHVDGVSLLQGLGVGVSQRKTKHRAHAGGIARCGT